MPDITGTNGNDNIDVTNDNGTLNGTPQGTPIDDVRGRGGADTITVTDSATVNRIRGEAGDDDITVSGSTISDRVSSGNGNDTVLIEGATVANVRLGAGDDTLNFIDTSVTGNIRGDDGTDTLNLPVGTVVSDAGGTFTVTLGGSYSLSDGTFLLPSGQTVTYTTFENGTGIPCFVHGTLLETTLGQKPIDQLKVGDVIPTQENGLQPIRWIGKRLLTKEDLCKNPKLRPIRITAGSLGNGFPNRDLLVSRQHRMLVQSIIAKRMFGSSEVLIAAIKMTELPGIFIDESVEVVEYYHLLFDRHEVIYAEGAPTESLFTGPEALKAISAEARDEILAIFPEVGNLDYSPHTVHLTPCGKLQKELVARHVKNNKSVLEHKQYD